MKASELILNPDGSIYHLGLKPGDLAKTIITVGDPERVAQVSKHFDDIIFTKINREIHTHTGFLNSQKISVISTGMGTDNIDIVLNEIDALFNIDLQNGSTLPQLTQLNIIRLGTSGTIQPTIPVDSFLVAKSAIGMDNLLHFYEGEMNEASGLHSFMTHLNWPKEVNKPYMVQADAELLNIFQSEGIQTGLIATHPGFYGPQGRKLRIPIAQFYDINTISSIPLDGNPITHFDMESAGIYGLCQLMGHRAISLSVILANRIIGSFSKNPTIAIDSLIRTVLNSCKHLH